MCVFLRVCVVYMDVCVCVGALVCVHHTHGFYNFCTISYFFRRSTLSFFGSYFFLAANFARSSAAVIFKFSPSLAPFVAVILNGDKHTHRRTNEEGGKKRENKIHLSDIMFESGVGR